MQEALTLVSTVQTQLQKSQITFAQKFLQLTLIHQSQSKPYQKSAAFEKYQFGSYPYLVTSSGQHIFSSNAIIKYLARKGKGMYGKNLIQHTEIDQCLDFCLLQLYPIVKAIQDAINGKNLLTKRVFNLYFLELKKIIFDLNERMKFKQWLAGMYISIADFALLPYLHYVLGSLITPSDRAKLPYIVSWYMNITHTNQFKQIIGPFALCNQSKRPNFYIKQHLNNQQIIDLDFDFKRKQKQQKIEFTDWLDKIKYQMLNHENKKQVIQNMLLELDIANYCLYKIQYQSYSNECSDEFKAINVRSNILSHLESLRDSAFAVTGVYGSEGGYSIRGVWLFKDSNLPNAWQVHPLYNYHNYLKLLPQNQLHKNIIVAYWEGMNVGGVVEGGLPIVTAKYFA